jgi:hypothetical protein
MKNSLFRTVIIPGIFFMGGLMVSLVMLEISLRVVSYVYLHNRAPKAPVAGKDNSPAAALYDVALIPALYGYTVRDIHTLRQLALPDGNRCAAGILAIANQSEFCAGDLLDIPLQVCRRVLRLLCGVFRHDYLRLPDAVLYNRYIRRSGYCKECNLQNKYDR